MPRTGSFFLRRNAQRQRVSDRADVGRPLGGQRPRNPFGRRRHGYNSRTHTLSEPPRGGHAERDRRHDNPFPRHESVRPMISADGSRALALSLAAVLAACEPMRPPPPPAVRFTVPVPEDRVLSSFAVSADGAAARVFGRERRQTAGGVCSSDRLRRDAARRSGAARHDRRKHAVFLARRLVASRISRAARSGACPSQADGEPVRVVGCARRSLPVAPGPRTAASSLRRSASRV